jgi:NADH-quinone oxidoreductase subunit J
MNSVFYVAALVAVVSTLLAVTKTNIVHSLLNLVVSLLSASLIFFLLGAPFVAALEVIVYAGAIMVLFIFVIMMLSVGQRAVEQERSWLHPGIWRAPAGLMAVLLGAMAYGLWAERTTMSALAVSPRDLSLVLYGPYLLAVEMASMLLLAGLIGAYHLGRRDHRDHAPTVIIGKGPQP